MLSIAGYDPSSGAGISADIKTAAAFGCYAITCITALTVQSTQGVFAVEPVRKEIIRETLRRLRDDFEIAAVRIGMLGSGAVAEEVAAFLERKRLPNVVIDPVIRSTSGTALIDPPGLEALRNRLLPLADLITPNIEEAATLAGLAAPVKGSTWEEAEAPIRASANRLHEIGCRGVLITGGHLADPVDVLSTRKPDGSCVVHCFSGKHLNSHSTHGTGCAMAAALACLLALGTDTVAAVTKAKEYVRQAIQQADSLGRGVGPVKHLH